MQIVVVDTDVVSFIFKNDSRGIFYEPHLTRKELVISFMTLAELKFWALQRNWGSAKRQRMVEYLQRFTVFHSDDELCLKWAEVIAIARRNGKPIATADAWIAATALLHKIPLITHNRKHYAGVVGLKIISEAAS
ncbi:MAG TPA: type II toxin-antitoxin system VapC family toxin [Blastocatellia bacterium]|jgi:predicted nucleic acid-binding protein|nr:type II toxin-antitoxin system VapC family toxin [Blastocatellia bacterium]